jgi:hypothetical protein
MYRFDCAFYCKIYQGNKLLNNNYYPSMHAYTRIIIYERCLIKSHLIVGYGDKCMEREIERVGESKCYANVGDNYRFCTTHTDELQTTTI